jgi:hypothetical protein
MEACASIFLRNIKHRKCTMQQLDEMDLTLYLQTEGRRLAAELQSKATTETRPENRFHPVPPASQSPALSTRRPSSRLPSQQQCEVPGGQGPARSLSEALQRMGVPSSLSRRM